MPPKSRIEREEILNRAFELARREGFESLTARGLAASLGCSTQPIYDAFTDRKALEAAAAGRAFAFMLRRMRENPEPDVPPDAATALGYIRFALEEGHLFRLIARNGLFAAPPAPEGNRPSADLPDMESAQPNAAELPVLPDPRLTIFANGILFMALYGTLPADWPSIRALVLSAREAFQNVDTHHGTL